MEGAGRGDELVQLGSGASYQATKLPALLFGLFLLLQEKRIGYPRTRSHRNTKKTGGGKNE